MIGKQPEFHEAGRRGGGDGGWRSGGPAGESGNWIPAVGL